MNEKKTDKGTLDSLRLLHDCILDIKTNDPVDETDEREYRAEFSKLGYTIPADDWKKLTRNTLIAKFNTLVLGLACARLGEDIAAKMTELLITPPSKTEQVSSRFVYGGDTTLEDLQKHWASLNPPATKSPVSEKPTPAEILLEKMMNEKNWFKRHRLRKDIEVALAVQEANRQTMVDAMPSLKEYPSTLEEYVAFNRSKINSDISDIFQTGKLFQQSSPQGFGSPMTGEKVAAMMHLMKNAQAMKNQLDQTLAAQEATEQGRQS